MHEEVVFAGFGGQGVLFAGQLLAYAAMAEQKHVTWIPSYGPEMRGGTANCTVVVSDDMIGSPLVSRPSIAVVFNNPSLLKYQERVKPGGLLVVNRSIVESVSERSDILCLEIPATDVANELGEVRLTNMVLCGAMLACRPVVALATWRETLTAELPARKKHLLEVNLTAIERGVTLAQAQIAAQTIV
ncbi:2-oxoacid:acceptor oxidoreductase family protein [Chloroflexota bacterium]